MMWWGVNVVKMWLLVADCVLAWPWSEIAGENQMWVGLTSAPGKTGERVHLNITIIGTTAPGFAACVKERLQ